MNTRGELLLYLRARQREAGDANATFTSAPEEREHIQRMIDWVRTKTFDETDPATAAEFKRPATLSEVAELTAAKARIRKLEAAAPVMLSVMAFVANEATEPGVRECVIWYSEYDPNHLETWLDAETARKERG